MQTPPSMSSSRFWRWSSPLLLPSIFACGAKEPTQLVVVIDGDLDSGSFERTEVTLSWKGNPGEEILYCGKNFPFSFGVSPMPGQLDVPVRVTGRAQRHDGTPVVDAVAETSFSENHALLLQLGLTKS